jgi:WD40 repeat protein
VRREDVLRQLDAWVDGPDETGWVVVTGGPGMGKSAILVAWLRRREAAGLVVPRHFIRRQVADWDQPDMIAASLATQIEAAFLEVRNADAKPERRLLELLGRVSKQLPAARRLAVLVDGLDDTRAEPGENPLPHFLPQILPAGICIVCATRPSHLYLNWILARTPVRRLDLDDRRWASSNEAVVRGLWEAVAPEYDPPLSPEMTAEAIARAEGNVLHAVMLHDALRDVPADERRADRIPRGLQPLIEELWDRVAHFPSVREGLGILCAAQEALSLDALEGLAGWSYDDRQRFVRDTRQLLREVPASGIGVDAYWPRHAWVREWIVAVLGRAAMRAHHATLARRLATWPPPAGDAARQYALRHGLGHRAEAEDWADAWRLATDPGFLEAKCRALGVHEAESDVAYIAARCRAAGDAMVARRFGDLSRALARESHLLRDSPELVASLLWNRLRRFGWSAGEIDEALRVPAGAGFLRVRHAVTRESTALMRDLVGHSTEVMACAITPDGTRIVSASDDLTLMVWDLETGRVLATLEGHVLGVTACAVTPDGRRAVSASWDHVLKVWDLETGRALATLESHSEGVTACAVTSDGRVVSASQDRTLKVWDLETGRVLATLEGHSSAVTACAVTPNGRVVSASQDRTLKVWDLESGSVLATLEGHSSAVTACAVTSDGRRVVSASWDQTLRLWELESGQALATLKGHGDGVTACAVTSDGRRVVSASWDHTLKVWDLGTSRLLATLEGHAHWVTACAVTPDGGRVVSASWDRTLKIWALETERALVLPGCHASRVTACAVTPDGGRVISASSDRTLKVWDLEAGSVLSTLEGHGDVVTACAVAPDRRRMVSASHDRTLKVWDLDRENVLLTLEGHADLVTACAVTPDGRRVISASRDHTLKVWDLASGDALATLEGHGSWVTACAVTLDGRRVVSASDDHTLKVWDLEARRALVTLEGHGDLVTACAVTPGGDRVVSASHDRTLKVWDARTGHLIATLGGHGDSVTACAVTPDGHRAVSASHDKSLRVWDLNRGTCLVTHRGDTAYTAIATSATAVVAGTDTGGLWILDWPR